MILYIYTCLPDLGSRCKAVSFQAQAEDHT